ncbi:putative Prefoldin subunit [Trypanosoma vivax]|uniref:Prefoldin subunit 4 n=1 Tax=Trypanosoma vivax (strain Y486) TaxID=1055687 RepID=G0U9U9_TRYVY|nr:putative prefoldin [Trypanosoma vivax]KAH8618994.1 putative Prefoldin subunit [Trypanosoma vivax]CCC52580.1 putative prefoldin [Trypanosoma vivax Y486]
MSLLKGKEVEVTEEDQRNICIFARLHRQHKSLLASSAQRKELIEKLGDAADELMIADNAMYLFGETFMDIDTDEAGEWLEKEKGILEREQEECEKELKDVETRLSELKAMLYASLGNQVYLEDE